MGFGKYAPIQIFCWPPEGSSLFGEVNLKGASRPAFIKLINCPERIRDFYITSSFKPIQPTFS
jgi:hypothetical protein